MALPRDNLLWQSVSCSLVSCSSPFCASTLCLVWGVKEHQISSHLLPALSHSFLSLFFSCHKSLPGEVIHSAVSLGQISSCYSPSWLLGGSFVQLHSYPAQQGTALAFLLCGWTCLEGAFPKPSLYPASEQIPFLRANMI